MVSSITVETLASPQSVLKDLFKRAVDAGKEDELPNLVTSHFSSVLSRDTDIDQVKELLRMISHEVSLLTRLYCTVRSPASIFCTFPVRINQDLLSNSER